MKYYLLLGAGFSRNWGGWLASEAFEYLLGISEIADSRELKDLLWRCQDNGGFEAALAELQSKFLIDPRTHGDNLRKLQDAVTRMFEDMNTGFGDDLRFNFSTDSNKSVAAFLRRFDAIFTLNQDLLLETHYFDRDGMVQPNGRWSGGCVPGMKPYPRPSGPQDGKWGISDWTPESSPDFSVPANFQPFYKLHGSSNWWESHGQRLLIMGGNKVREIGASPVLSNYYQVFEESLQGPDARLMVIGYGFRDRHINDAISSAVNDHGMKFFVIAPEGGDLAKAVNTSRPGQIFEKQVLDHVFARGMIGASRRPISATFGPDNIEFGKVMRFFGGEKA